MRSTSSALLLSLTFLGFVSLGLPDAITGVAWPSVSKHFGIPLGDLGILLISFTSGYLISSFSIARLLSYLKVGGLLTLSCTLVILSLFGFSLAPSWPFYIASSVIAGLSAGAIDTGLNAFAARNFSARHMSWLHACWGIGATSGAAIAAAVIGRGLAWQWAYALVGLILIPITLIFARYRALWNEEKPSPGESSAEKTKATPWEALRHPAVLVQILVFFLYVGVEATVGQWAFTLLTQYRGFHEGIAGTLVSVYWGSLTLARFLLGTIADRLGLKTLLMGAASVGLIGGLLFVVAPWPILSMIGLLILGVSLAPIYPGMMSHTPGNVGRFSDVTVGLQVAAAVVGQVCLPSAGGLLLKGYGFTALNLMLGAFLVSLWIAMTLLFWTRFGKLHRPF